MSSSRTRSTALSVVGLTIALLLAGCGGEDSAPVTFDPNGCRTVDKPAAKDVEVPRPTETLDPKARNIVNFRTNCGDFQVLLDAENNPRTSSSMAHLVQEGLYDGTWFHRIVAGFVVQGGDPAADGSGGSGWDIVEPPTGDYRIGTIAMAKSGSDPTGTSSSQFYIVIGKDGTQLPPDYAIAGRLAGGFDVVEKIAQYAPSENSQSDTPVGVAVVEKATLIVDGE